MARPFWSGQLRISLVSFGIELFPATEAKSEIRFHQLNRRTGERVRHQNVSGEETPVDNDEIVKGYEYSKGEYVMIKPEDIANLRIPSRNTLDIEQFIVIDELSPEFFEKPYFVTPDNPTQAEAFAVVRKALQSSNKAALGKIAFGGREHLVAISAPQHEHQLGLMAYTLRYAQELRDPAEYFANIKPVKIDADQLSLATELIKRKTAAFDPGRFTDEYEDALRAMVEAKIKHAPLPKSAPASKSTKVVNLMDALRKSVKRATEHAPKRPAKKTAQQSASQRLTLVTPSKSRTRKHAQPARKHKSA